MNCPNRCPTPNGIGTICRKTFDLLPAGPQPGEQGFAS